MFPNQTPKDENCGVQESSGDGKLAGSALYLSKTMRNQKCSPTRELTLKCVAECDIHHRCEGGIIYRDLPFAALRPMSESFMSTRAGRPLSAVLRKANATVPGGEIGRVQI